MWNAKSDKFLNTIIFSNLPYNNIIVLLSMDVKDTKCEP